MMTTKGLNFNNAVHETENYINTLATALNHPNEPKRVLIIWRAVMHSVRDRIHPGESFDIIAPLPIILKGVYVQGWKYHPTPPLKYMSLEEMKSAVKNAQNHYGERSFPWEESTETIIAITLNSIRGYLPKEQMDKILNQMPKEVAQYLHDHIA